MSMTGPEIVQAVILKAGLKLYAETGRKPGRLWTPRNMMKTAERLTGKKFPSRGYTAAISALEQLLEEDRRVAKSS